LDLSFAICTYNRFELALKCVRSICDADCPSDFKFEILLIDNNSSDDTSLIPDSIKDERLVYCFEKNQGLSYARNSAIENATSKWLAFIDDDGILHEDFILEWNNLKNKNEFACIGGKYLAYFDDEKPRWWPEEWGTKPDLRPQYGEIFEPKLSGGVLMLNLEMLPTDIRFKVELGMKGDITSFGEENYLQNELLKSGLKLAYTPSLKIDHLVAVKKTSVMWHLKVAFISGRLTWKKHRGKNQCFLKVLQQLKQLSLNSFKTSSALQGNSLRKTTFLKTLFWILWHLFFLLWGK
jgi:glycosyltransferase involved in cell wall biosynthesis